MMLLWVVNAPIPAPVAIAVVVISPFLGCIIATIAVKSESLGYGIVTAA